MGSGEGGAWSPVQGSWGGEGSGHRTEQRDSLHTEGKAIVRQWEGREGDKCGEMGLNFLAPNAGQAEQGQGLGRPFHLPLPRAGTTGCGQSRTHRSWCPRLVFSLWGTEDISAEGQREARPPHGSSLLKARSSLSGVWDGASGPRAARQHRRCGWASRP